MAVSQLCTLERDVSENVFRLKTETGYCEIPPSQLQLLAVSPSIRLRYWTSRQVPALNTPPPPNQIVEEASKTIEAFSCFQFPPQTIRRCCDVIEFKCGRSVPRGEVYGEWSASRSGRFAPGERFSGTHWVAGWAGPTVSPVGSL
jgi:hypothetical protein